MHLPKAALYKLYCDVCEVFLASKANYALHVLTKEHCENLIKVGKPTTEPICVCNEGIQEESSDIEISEAVPGTVEHAKSTSIPSNGCFVSGNSCSTNESPTELDSVDSQSLAETPLNQQVVSTSDVINSESTDTPMFCKKITKSLISCEICNVVLTTIPDYESHMKSPQHVWNMKFRGLGITAHFVKTKSDSQPTNALEVSTNSPEVNKNDLGELIPDCETLALIPFPLLYCDACELLINTPQQFNSHMNGSNHKLSVKKKGKMKIKTVKFPVPNKSYCYSCKMVLNGVVQFSEHKMGKKHKIRCSQLITLGYTIPPEEQLPEWNLPQIDPDKPVHYPEFYEKFVIAKQREEIEKSNDFKELLMDDSDCESNECIKTLDVATPEDISEGMQNLTTKSESVLSHIYRVQNKSIQTHSELPFTIIRNNYLFRDS